MTLPFTSFITWRWFLKNEYCMYNKSKIHIPWTLSRSDDSFGHHAFPRLRHSKLSSKKVFKSLNFRALKWWSKHWWWLGQVKGGWWRQLNQWEEAASHGCLTTTQELYCQRFLFFFFFFSAITFPSFLLSFSPCLSVCLSVTINLST